MDRTNFKGENQERKRENGPKTERKDITDTVNNREKSEKIQK